MPLRGSGITDWVWNNICGRRLGAVGAAHDDNLGQTLINECTVGGQFDEAYIMLFQCVSLTAQHSVFIS